MDLDRRDFHKLTLAALGGAITGSLAGCGESQPPGVQSGTETQSEAVTVAGEPHLCRGLNECKGQGADGKNSCAGMGTCASKAWHHACAGDNNCKGQGGCGSNPGLNECKGQGACHVPLMPAAWDTVRARFEEQMKKEGKEVGTAPPAKDS